MTYFEAIENGYTNGEQAYHRGYISRRIDQSSQPVKIAGGSRKGQLYVELPCWQSSQYIIRQYLIPVCGR